MSEKPASATVELYRHGHKDERGELSKEGIEAARLEARTLFERLRTAHLDSVLYIIPSNISRSQKTRDVLENRLRELAEENPEENIHVVDFSANHQPEIGVGKKYIVVGCAPDARLGFNPEEESNKAFRFYQELFENDEEYVARTWVARRSELGDLAEDINARFPDFRSSDLRKIVPSRFGITPEEIAIRQLEAIEETTISMNEKYPDQPLMGTYIGHAPAVDFVAMAVLGEEINLTNFKRIEGLRKYLESSTFQVENGEVVMGSFRGRSLVEGVRISLRDVKKTLQKQSEARRKEWGEP